MTMMILQEVNLKIDHENCASSNYEWWYKDVVNMDFMDSDTATISYRIVQLQGNRTTVDRNRVVSV